MRSRRLSRPTTSTPRPTHWPSPTWCRPTSRTFPNATNWLFVAKTQAIPAGLGQDGVAGGTGVNADRAAVAAGAGQTNVGFYSLDAGKCGGF